jgi:PAS domain S-box-containing protein
MMDDCGLRNTLQWAHWALTIGLLVYACVLQRRNGVQLRTVLRDRDLLRTLINSMPDFIYAKDVNCRFILANKFCCEVMGTTPERVQGRTDFDFYPAHLAKKFFDDEQSVLQSGEALLSRQEDAIDRSGQTLTILTTKVPLKDAEGRTIGIIGMGRDITARVAAERQLQAAQDAMHAEMRERERMAIELQLAQRLESVGRLAAGIAHELNTPIQYVGDSIHFLRSAHAELSALFLAYRQVAHSGAVGMNGVNLVDLRQMERQSDYEFLAEEVPKALERSLEGTERVAAIVRAMKEFAHPGINEQQAADLNRALNTTITVARSEYKHIARVELELEPLPDVVCNMGEINQVLLNLIVNAAHAIADAGKDASTGLISIRTQRLDTQVRVTIEDNGCGISGANVDKIFDPFFTTKEVGRGTGQGLAIARSIVVDKHRGEIQVSSAVGRGTTFTVVLPVQGF